MHANTIIAQTPINIQRQKKSTSTTQVHFVNYIQNIETGTSCKNNGLIYGVFSSRYAMERHKSDREDRDGFRRTKREEVEQQSGKKRQNEFSTFEIELKA